MGSALVLTTFPMSTSGSKVPVEELPPGGPRIAGVRATEGRIKRAAAHVRVLRDGVEIARVSARMSAGGWIGGSSVSQDRWAGLGRG